MAKQTGSIDLKAAKSANDEASKVATNYLAVDTSGIMVYDGTNGTQTPSNPDSDTNNVFIDEDSLDIRKGTDVLATFGADGAQIGQIGESHLEMDYHSMQLVDKENHTYFHVSDLRTIGEDGIYAAVIEEWRSGTGSNRYYLNYPSVEAPISITVDGVAQVEDTDYYYSNDSTYGTIYFISQYPPQDAEIIFKYRSTTWMAKAYTLGIRNEPSTKGMLSVAIGSNVKAQAYASCAEGLGTNAEGAYSHAEGCQAKAIATASHAEGWGTEASGWYSHAEGLESKARGKHSHAEGWRTEASGLNSHAEGDYTVASGTDSHAEGIETTASGHRSHAEGMATIASGTHSHVQNLGTIASKNHQTAIGKWNIEDTATETADQKALIIGNGTGTNARSNALTVDWSGNTWCAGDVTDGSGNVLSNKIEASDIPITQSAMLGFIQMFAGQTAPTGWLMCDGTAVSRTDYADLYSVIGDTYGAGDGSTTFNLPDLRNRFPVGAGDTYNLNGQGGDTTATIPTTKLTDQEIAHGHGHTLTMPNHVHSMTHAHEHSHGTSGGHNFVTGTETIYRRSIKPGTSTAVTNNYYGAGSLGQNQYTDKDATKYTGNSGNPTTQNPSIGGSVSNLHGASSTRTAHGHGSISTVPPYIGINFIIYAGA